MSATAQPPRASDPTLGDVDLALAAVLSDVAQAQARAGALLEAARRDGDPAAEATAWLVHAVIGLRESAIEPALEQARRAEVLLACAPNPRARALLRHVRAQALRCEGRTAEALDLLAALHGESAQRLPVDAFLSAMALGTVQGMQDLQDESLATFYGGLALARRIGLPSLEVNALNNLGSVQLDLYNLEDALPLLRRCLELALAIGSRRQRIFAAGNLVQCLCAMGQAQEALALTREHLIPVIRPDDPPNLQRDEEIAYALIESGLFDEARGYLARTPRPDVLTNPTTASRVWLEMRVLLADDRAAQALALGLSRRAVTDDSSVMPVDRVRVAEITAEAAQRCEQWREAYKHQRHAYALKDVLLGRAARARFVSLRILHDLAHAQAERDDARDLARRLEQANLELQAQMADNEALRRQLEGLALEDPLTGLGNRRALFHSAQALLDQARRHGGTVALALVDLDHFKSINDRYGHDAGDRVLQAFARLARHAVRPGDLVCRYGGEEFVVVFGGAPAGVAAERMTAMLAAFAQEQHDGGDARRFGCTFSAGVTESFEGDDDLSAMLRRADEALYAAKASGRARVELARSARSDAGAVAG